MTLHAGTTVGPYEIVAPIGAGGMGEVYRARDRKLDREVALKVLSAELSASAEHLRRFEQEARAASALNHPNIIAIYDVGRIDSVSYIAMELVDGHDLRSMTAEAPIPLKRVLRIACKVADGLAAAHEKGIVHRDLKPENVIVSNEGFVKIVDFGLAKLVSPFSQTDTTRPHTSPGSVFGTVGYMSPEQASGKATDFRGDQFSFGVILFELLASQRPFERPSAAETMTAIIREDAPLLPEGLEPVRDRLEGVLGRCLAKDPRERYGSTRDLARDLREIRDAITRPADSGRRSAPLPHPKVVRGRISRVAGAVAMVAAVAVGVLVVRDYTRVPTRGARSVAVLPFRNLGGSVANQDFTDGLSETIAARLAEAPSLRVVSPFDGVTPSTVQSAAEVARRRGVDVLLRGSVQHSGDILRVTYAVIEGSTGRQMAGQTVTGPARDLFAFEDNVADQILRSLGAAPVAAHRSTVALTTPRDQKLYVEA
ncbi:MAG: serine/threonine-protein kinase, partial [Thermoanaerobaculia bacterium]